MAFSGDKPIAEVILKDEDGNSATISLDAADSKRRVAVEGKVQVTAPVAPPTSTAVTIDASSPLIVGPNPTSHTTEYVIANGKTFFIQQIIAGAEADPSEKGSKIEVAYFDGTTEHLVDRVYVTGFTQFGIYPDTSKTRDGTTMTGNGTTKVIRVKRQRMSTSGQEIDAVVRGYEQ